MSVTKNYIILFCLGLFSIFLLIMVCDAKMAQRYAKEAETQGGGVRANGL